MHLRAIPLYVASSFLKVLAKIGESVHESNVSFVTAREAQAFRLRRYGQEFAERP